MKALKLNTASCEENEKKLIPIGDLHYGHPNCDIEKVESTLKYCRENNAWIILMGDLIENSTKSSVGAGVFEQTIPPTKQKRDIIELLEPYTDLIIGSHIGNHEQRTLNTVGDDPHDDICHYLKIPNLGYSCFTRLKVGKQSYIIYSTHGSTGATKPNTKMSGIMNLARSFRANLYLMGHTHRIATDCDTIDFYNSKNKTIETNKRYYGLTGSFLKYKGSYAEMKNLPPEKTGVIKIKLYGDSYDIHITT